MHGNRSLYRNRVCRLLRRITPFYSQAPSPLPPLRFDLPRTAIPAPITASRSVRTILSHLHHFTKRCARSRSVFALTRHDLPNGYRIAQKRRGHGGGKLHSKVFFQLRMSNRCFEAKQNQKGSAPLHGRARGRVYALSPEYGAITVLIHYTLSETLCY